MTTPTQSQPVHPAAEEAASQGYEQQLFSLGCDIEFILSNSVFSLSFRFLYVGKRHHFFHHMILRCNITLQIPAPETLQSPLLNMLAFNVSFGDSDQLMVSPSNEWS